MKSLQSSFTSGFVKGKEEKNWEEKKYSQHLEVGRVAWYLGVLDVLTSAVHTHLHRLSPQTQTSR